MDADRIINSIENIKKNQAQKHYSNVKKIVIEKIDYYHNKDYAQYFINSKKKEM